MTGRAARTVRVGARAWWVCALALALGASPAVAQATDEPLSTVVESGPVELTVRLSPPAPAIGDPLTLELEARAEGGVELLMPEFGEALDRFAIVDFSQEETATDDGGILSRQRYTLAPSRSGSQRIPALLVEFVDRRPGRDPAPEGEDAYELLSEAIAFEVASALPEGAPLEFRPALGALHPLRAPGSGPWLWLGLAAGALALAAPFGYRAWRAWRRRALRRSAYEIARAGLDALLMAPRPSESEMDEFFVELSAIIRRYLEDRFSLRSPELTTEEFLEALVESPDLVRSHQTLLRDFLKRADLVKFAHYVPAPGDVEDSLDSARRFLESTRDDAVASGPTAGATGA